MSDRDDPRDTRDNTRECGSMFDPRAPLVTPRADTHTPAGRQRAPCPTDRDRPI